MKNIVLENRLVELEKIRVEFEEMLKDYNIETNYNENDLWIECEGDSSRVKRICLVVIKDEGYEASMNTVVSGKSYIGFTYKADDEKELRNILIQMLL